MTDPLMKYLSITKGIAHAYRVMALAGISLRYGEAAANLRDAVGRGYEPGDMAQQSRAATSPCWTAVLSIPGDVRLIFARDTGGDENTQLYLIDPAQSGIIQLTAGLSRPGTYGVTGQPMANKSSCRQPARSGPVRSYLRFIGGAERMVWQNDRPGLPGPIRFPPDASRAIVVQDASRFEHGCTKSVSRMAISHSSARQVRASDSLACSLSGMAGRST
jgi:hypothetical protein